MTKKDYILIVKAIKLAYAQSWSHAQDSGVELVIQELEKVCQQDNPRFNVEKFRQAIGV